MRRLTALTVVAAACAAVLAAPPGASAAPSQQSASGWIVRYAAGTDMTAAAAAAHGRGAQVGRAFSHTVRALTVAATPAQAAALAAAPGVLSVEPDAPVRVTGTQAPVPSWGLDRIDQLALPLSGSYSYPDAAGRGVRAYIIDTGILASHADFGGRVTAGYTAVADGNGTTDCNGHGTHVAGTVGGAAHGVAKAVTLVPVRVLDCAGSGLTSGVIAGVDWAAADHQPGVPAVANLSLGGGASPALDAAVASLVADGVTVAVAAGNSGADACASSPARAPSALTVGATTSGDARASFSNYGTCLDLFAPGVSIVSDAPSSTTATAVMSGTSMASPHVAGAAASLLGVSPALTPAQVASSLASAAAPGAVTSAGTGSPNLLLQLAGSPTAPPPPAPVTAPAAPTGVSAVSPARGKLRVSWQAGPDGGSPLTAVLLRVTAGGKVLSTFTLAPSALSATVSGIRSGTNVTASVAQVNSVGTGAWVSSARARVA